MALKRLQVATVPHRVAPAMAASYSVHMAAFVEAFTRRAEALAGGVRNLEAGAPSFAFLGRTYAAADLPTLDTVYEYYLHRAAREAILAGAQEHSLLGRTFKRADLAEIRRAIDVLQPRVDAILGQPASRVGTRIRYAVPLG